MSTTLDYYNNNAQAFAAGTLNVAMNSIQDQFLKLLPDGACILDFGCGAGRDTRYFLSKGYRVDAIDGSEELCKIASEVTGIPVKHMYFQNLTEVEKYDGIWACSSILHLDRMDLKLVLGKLAAATVDGGVIYTSFKYGHFSGERNGRFFTDMTEESFAKLLDEVGGLSIIEQWVTTDVRPDRSDEKWLNLILRKIR